MTTIILEIDNAVIMKLATNLLSHSMLLTEFLKKFTNIEIIVSNSQLDHVQYAREFNVTEIDRIILSLIYPVSNSSSSISSSSCCCN